MPTNRMSGNLLGLEIDGTFVQCETSCNLEIETDMLPASAITSGRFKEIIPGMRSWQMSVNANMLLRAAGSSIAHVLDLYLSGGVSTVRFMIKNENFPEFTVYGQAYLQAASINGEVNTDSTWDATFIGTGELSKVISEPDIYNTMYYGTSLTRPTTESQIEALFTTDYSSPVTLDTGFSHRFYVIAIPSDKTIISVYNQTADEDVTSQYISTVINIDGVPFDVFVMETAVPYSANNEHIITLS